MKKIIAVIGPTATGKTNLAVILCQKFNGEIISVDSRQAYKEMNIGTGKSFGDGSVPIHLYDLVNPDERLNAHDFAAWAWEKIKELQTRKKAPFLVGGTGFYMDIILGRRKLSGIGVDLSLRQELETLSTEDLITRLKKADIQKAKTVDINNRYRLIRAVEIASSLVILSKAKDLDSSGRTPQNDDRGMVKYDFGDILIIGLTGENPYLYTRADARVEEMIDKGLLDEVKGLVKKYGWEAPGLNALGYREFKPYLEGQVQLNESVQRLKYDTHAYIRRQKTYFKKYFADAAWFDVTEAGFDERISSKVELFLT